MSDLFAKMAAEISRHVAEAIQQAMPQIAASIPRDRLIPVTKWEQYCAWPSTRSLQALIKEYPQASWVLNVEGRQLIDETAFIQWCRVNGHGADETVKNGRGRKRKTA